MAYSASPVAAVEVVASADVEAAADVEVETENRSIRDVAEEVVAILLERGIMTDQMKA